MIVTHDCIIVSASYNIGYQYIVSLYWAFTTTITVGYGDIHAHTDSEVRKTTIITFLLAHQK